ncbi:M56 family metallopeptidase [Parenemella sanctibonifatiensis]|uniref:Peptidase M48 domain-containing protein n=1 Tax=Parenemella sanctibonifatiensis TaxID=2016505 RepID=A0A255EDK1_9ACTN|nr:M56 family metallopeptidase [Parenemella sanctibonifatiensis]OYN89638.1 hypothetical protein CGZ92_02675 [Parenemella sanctibonifatiensis]
MTALLLPAALFLAALLTVLGVPVALVGAWQVDRPKLALTAWFAALVLGGGCAVASVVAAVAAAGQGRPGSWAAWLWAWVGVAGAIAVVGLVSGLSGPMADAERRSLRRLAPIATERLDRGTFTLVRFAHPAPVAIAVPGRRPEIMVSDSLESLLSRGQLQAVLAHEYAHLRGRHGVLMRLAELNAACLPFLPAADRLRRATRLLIELAADDVAARQVGAEQLATALEALADEGGAPGAAERAVRLRGHGQQELPRGLPAALQV